MDTNLIFLLLTVNIASTLFLIYIFKQNKKDKNETKSIINTEHPIAPLSYINIPIIPPGQNFNDALNLNSFANQTANDVKDILKKSPLNQYGIVSYTVHNLLNSQSEHILKYPEHAEKLRAGGKLIEMRTKTGEILPILVEKDSGRIFALDKKVPPDLFTKLPQIATLVIAGAHFISNWENSKRIGLIDKQLKSIGKSYHNERLAELESIFESLKEINLSNEKSQLQLDNYKKDLKKYRSLWMRDALDLLSDISDPENELFIIRKRATAEQIKIEVNKIRDPLYLAALAFNLEKRISIFTDLDVSISAHGFRDQINNLIELIDINLTRIQKLNPTAETNDFNDLKNMCNDLLQHFQENKNAAGQEKITLHLIS